MKTIKEKEKETYQALKGDFGWKNIMAAPHITKVVVSVGTGKTADRKGRLELVSSRLAKITGQRPTPRAAKKSIASFKLREGENVGVAVTLRGERMWGFLEKFINVAVPRMRDFRGFDRKAIDAMGNLTLGIKENTIFPETADEDLRDVFGFAVTIVTTAKTKPEAVAFFDGIGVPFKKA
ncbi:MAG: 50S ribosomal protein L5 [Candidatus Yonathbacteria bacterium RIFOXYC1_FULL_52_10]|uniref:Large ribosomal subunit protein uL5 n=1 Tax=Candidatus Yonathbacteria bacterium RIFOXYD1_FULL_52_36 TaxID=1802730 RepID=A0A1G2SJF7_9BACT|nr:MAG: 50S ribosomal protein L5 [Candidatus Yonathbacteria bacterium RIFOXYC1_FULL_52_10]OHA84872.1 MAG: 50S ribosomal protein L5 [Candidatus Yonathbacteria bacterium RIFOXYD1_FULL_52_36]